ncbi:zinc finger protein 846-like [Folsomia candida]|uniref:zinc finger protein 846-like n=1 Tax=Folsomia candida TaxID=158441 RepID=UPI0016054E83|nr:zinc finger protein 846-like [Folsomia candida]
MDEPVFPETGNQAELGPPFCKIAKTDPASKVAKKTPRRPTPQEKTSLKESPKKVRQKFGRRLIDTSAPNRKMYEGYEIAVESGNYTCLACGFVAKSQPRKNYNSKDIIKLHVKSQHFNAFRCEPCEKNYTSKYILQKHIKKMHSLGRLPTHVCTLCGKIVSNIFAHLWGHKSPLEKEAAIQSGAGFLPCDKCGKEFSGQDRLAAHLTQGNRCKGNKDYAESDTSNPSYRKIPCRICARPVTVYGHAQHEWTHKNEAEKEESIRLGTSPKVRCEICKIHVFHNAYKAHFETHKKPEEKTKFHCEWDGCGRKFGRKVYLNLHMKTMHQTSESDLPSGENCSAGLRCPDPSCSSLRFTSQPNLKSHIARWIFFSI